MRVWNRMFRLAIALLGSFVVGCGGGGGGSSSALDPLWISNLSYTPTAAYVDSGGGQVTVTGSIAFSSANGGAASVTIEIADSGGTIVSTSTTPVAGGGVMYGSVQGTVVASTIAIGDYTIRVTLTDAAGRVSNTLSGSFRVAEDAWVAKTPMPTARTATAVAASGGLVYVMGGGLLGTTMIPPPVTAIVEIYDPATDSWSTGNSMPTARKYAAVAELNGVIYVIGGDSLPLFPGLSIVEAYDTVTGTWTTKASLPYSITEAAAVAFNGQICVFGGENGGSSLSRTECYDPTADSWSPQADMSTPRYGLGAGVIGGYAYAMGGYQTVAIKPNLKTAERSDLVSLTWTPVTSMTTERMHFGVTTASGLLYAIGGGVEAYDPSLVTWTVKTQPSVSFVDRVGAETIGGMIYVFDSAHTLQYAPGNDIL